MKNFKYYLLIYLKGIAMGSADVVPGVSGGTIAFITGIYDKLIESISAVKPQLIKDLFKGNFKLVWEKINGSFLFTLLAGIATSIFSLAKILTFLMQYYPIQLWSFFFGLILASIIYVGKQVKHWSIGSILGVILGTIFIYYISSIPPLSPENSYLYLFFAGSLAACAMILPGISGSFILLLLGAYTSVIAAIGNHDFVTIAIIGIGAATGLILFSKLLNYLLNNYHNTLIGVLTGFLIGSLWKIWPWKIDETVYVKEQGIQTFTDLSNGYQSLSAYMQGQNREQFQHISSYVERNISPFTYELSNNGMPNNIIYSIIFCIFGFSLIFIIEYIAKTKNV